MNRREHQQRASWTPVRSLCYSWTAADSRDDRRRDRHLCWQSCQEHGRWSQQARSTVHQHFITEPGLQCNTFILKAWQSVKLSFHGRETVKRGSQVKSEARQVQEKVAHGLRSLTWTPVLIHVMAIIFIQDGCCICMWYLWHTQNLLKYFDIVRPSTTDCWECRLCSPVPGWALCMASLILI